MMEDSFQRNLNETTPRMALRAGLKLFEPEETPMGIASPQRRSRSLRKRMPKIEANAPTHSSKRILEDPPSDKTETKRIQVTLEHLSKSVISTGSRNIKGVDRTYADISLGDDSSMNESIDLQAASKFRKLRSQRKRGLSQHELSVKKSKLGEKDTGYMQDTEQTYEGINFTDDSSLDGSLLAPKRKIQSKRRSKMSLLPTEKTYADLSSNNVDSSSDSISLQSAKAGSLRNRVRGSSLLKMGTVLPPMKSLERLENSEQKYLGISDSEEEVPVKVSEQNEDDSVVKKAKSLLEDTVTSDMDDSNTTLDRTHTTKRQLLSQRAPAIQLNVSSILRNIKIKPIPEVDEETSEELLKEIQQSDKRMFSKAGADKIKETVTLPPPPDFRDESNNAQISNRPGSPDANKHGYSGDSSDNIQTDIQSTVSSILSILDEDSVVSANKSQTFSTTREDTEPETRPRRSRGMDYSGQREDLAVDDFLSKEKGLESPGRVSPAKTGPRKSLMVQSENVKRSESKKLSSEMNLHVSNMSGVKEFISETMLVDHGDTISSLEMSDSDAKDSQNNNSRQSSKNSATPVAHSVSQKKVTNRSRTPTADIDSSRKSMDQEAVSSPRNHKSSIAVDLKKNPTSFKQSKEDKSLNQSRTPSQGIASARKEETELDRTLSPSKQRTSTRRAVNFTTSSILSRSQIIAHEESMSSPRRQSPRKSTEKKIVGARPSKQTPRKSTENMSNYPESASKRTTPSSPRRQSPRKRLSVNNTSDLNVQNSSLSGNKTSNLKSIVLSSNEVQVHPEEALKAQQMYEKITHIEGDTIDTEIPDTELSASKTSSIQDTEKHLYPALETSPALNDEEIPNSDKIPDVLHSHSADQAGGSRQLGNIDINKNVRIGRAILQENENIKSLSSPEFLFMKDTDVDNEDENEAGEDESLSKHTILVKEKDNPNIADSAVSEIIVDDIENVEESSGDEDQLNWIPLTIRRTQDGVEIGPFASTSNVNIDEVVEAENVEESSGDEDKLNLIPVTIRRTQDGVEIGSNASTSNLDIDEVVVAENVEESSGDEDELNLMPVTIRRTQDGVEIGPNASTSNIDIDEVAEAENVQESSGDEVELNLIPVTIRRSQDGVKISPNIDEDVNSQPQSHRTLIDEVEDMNDVTQKSQKASDTPKTKQMTMREFLQRLATKQMNPAGTQELKPEIRELFNKKSIVPKTTAVVSLPVKKKTEKVLPLSLPGNITREIFTHYSKCRVSREAMTYVEKASERFWKNTAVDLLNISQGRSATIDITREDVEQLMIRQEIIKDSKDLVRLIEEFLPAEEWDLLLPTAYAKNRVYPPDSH